jgi:hypothetical protein
MSVGWLHRAQTWLHESCGATLVGSEIRDVEQGATALRFGLHPTAEDVVLRAWEHSRITALASTWRTGAGYHAHVCEVLRDLSEALALAWDPPDGDPGEGDSTGYFYSSDRGELEQAMLECLRRHAQDAVGRLTAGEATATLALPTEHQFDFDGAVATPMGPRTREWLQRVVENPRQGLDVFSWWEPGRGAAYRLGRAVAEMWTSVRWRPPETAEEVGQLQRILAWLHSAYLRDATLDYPWREWEELRGYLDGADPVPTHARRATRPLIGYRRRNVRVRLGDGWSISIPGSFAESREGDGTYCAWGDGKTVWFTSLEDFHAQDSPPAEALLPGLDTGERPVDVPGLSARFTAQAGVMDFSEERRRLHKLNARVALPGRLVLFTLVYDKPEAEAWAITTLESVQYDG